MVQIAQCDVLVVIDKPSATRSDAIERELAHAKKLKKPIVAVIPQQTKNPNRSSVVAEYADYWVAWNSNTIAQKVFDLWLEKSGGHSGGWFSKLMRRD